MVRPHFYKQLIDIKQRRRFRITWLHATRRRYQGIAVIINGWGFGLWFSGLRSGRAAVVKFLDALRGID